MGIKADELPRPLSYIRHQGTKLSRITVANGGIWSLA